MVVVVVVAVVAVMVLGVMGYSILRHASATAPTVLGTPLAYSQTVGPTQSALASQSGGPWNPAAVLGIASSESPSGAGGIVSGCTEPWVNGTFEVAPATPSNATAGKVSTWLVISENSGGVILMTLVSELTSTVIASNLAELQGSCVSAYTGHGALANPVVDSTAVAGSANANGGAGFLSANPGATRAFLLVGGLWMVIYTTCDMYQPSAGPGSEFLAAYNATTGSTSLSGQSGPTTC